MYGRDSGDKLVICPYDKTHQILAKSFSNHLVKCRQNHPGHKYETCKFNSLHIIPKPEISHHHSQCPDQYLLAREMQVKASGGVNILAGKLTGPEISRGHVEAEEDWDSGPAYKSQALFDREREVEEEPLGPYIPPGANYRAQAPFVESTNKQTDGDNFRKVPLGPSRAAQVSASLASKQDSSGSGDQVSQFSYRKGVGRGVAFNHFQHNPNVEPQRQATSAPGYASTPAQAPMNPQSFGRGVAAYANNGSAGRGFTMNFDSTGIGRGTAANSANAMFSRAVAMDAYSVQNASLGRDVARYANNSQTNFPPGLPYQQASPFFQDPSRQMNNQNSLNENVMTSANPNWQGGAESDIICNINGLNFQRYQQQECQQNMYQAQLQNPQINPRTAFSQTVPYKPTSMGRGMIPSATASHPALVTPWTLQGYPACNTTKDVESPDLRATESQKYQPGEGIDRWKNFSPSQNAERVVAGLSSSKGNLTHTTDSSNPDTTSDVDSSSAVESLSQSLSSHSLLDTGDESSVSVGGESSKTEEEAAILREKRKLVKRLKQMTALEEKAAKGEKLTNQEKLKLEKKQETLIALENLSKNL